MNKLLKQQKKNQRYKIKTKSKIIKNKRGGSKLNKKRKYKLTKKHGGGTVQTAQSKLEYRCECKYVQDRERIEEKLMESFESPPNTRTKEGKLKKRGSTLSFLSILWDERYVTLNGQYFQVYAGSEKLNKAPKHEILLKELNSFLL